MQTKNNNNYNCMLWLCGCLFFLDEREKNDDECEIKREREKENIN